MTESPVRALLGPSLLASALAGSFVGLVPALTSGGSVSAWLLAAASAALLLGPATVGVTSNESWHKPAFWLAAGLALTLTPLMILGRLLKTTTHHRPLGAATFAAIACIVVLASVAVCWRAGKLAEDAPPARGRLIRSVVGGAALVSALWALVGLAKLASSSDFIFGFLQVGLLLAGLGLAAQEKTQSLLRRIPALVGAGAWLLLVLAGGILAISLDPRSLDPEAAAGPSTAFLWLLFAP